MNETQSHKIIVPLPPRYIVEKLQLESSGIILGSGKDHAGLRHSDDNSDRSGRRSIRTNIKFHSPVDNMGTLL